MLLLPLGFLVAFCETGQMRDFMTVGTGRLATLERREVLKPNVEKEAARYP